MSKRARVVWNEGLLLSPQHFQHLDRYHEELAGELFRAGHPFGFGFTALDLDAQAIQNGQVVLHRARGVLPGGGPFDLPDRDEGPRARNIEEEFPSGETRLPLHFGVRVHRPGERQLAPGSADNSDLRYRSYPTTAADETTGEDDRELIISRRNFKILLPHENLGDYDQIPMAEVVRTPEGTFTYDTTFVPPCLGIGASDHVLRVLRRLHEILNTKSRELSDRRRHSGKHVAEFGRDDVAGFWLLGTINGYIPLLAHYLRTRNVHPERLYADLAMLAGRLTTMSDQDVREIPPYDHDQPGLAFTDLGRRIANLIEIVLPRHFTRIELTRRDDSVFVGRIDDDRLLEPDVDFYLGVFAAMPAGELQADLPAKIKIATPEQVDFLISNALMGVGIRHVAALPASLPVQSGYVYFQIEKAGDVWDLVAGAHAIAVYAPPDFPGVQFELIALRD